MDDEPLHNSDEPALPDHDAIIQRRDDQSFMFEMERLVQESEEARLGFMISHNRRSLISTTITILSILTGSSGFAWFFLMLSNLPYALASIITGIALPIIIAPWKKRPLHAYTRYHKTTFMPKMAQAMGGFKFFAHRGIGSKLIQKTGVLAPYEAYDAEDCFMGLYKNIKVIMSEARLYQDKEKKRPVFDGLFVLLELPSDRFEGHTIVTADQQMVKSYAHSRWSSLKPVSTPSENAEWSRFHIFSNKPESAVEQVNERFLKELLETSDIFDTSPLSAVMFGKKFIFIAIPYEEDMFEACNMFVPVTLKSYIHKCKHEIEQLLEIVDIYEFYDHEVTESEREASPDHP